MIFSNMGSSISASSGALTWEEVSTSSAESSSLRGCVVAKARESGLFGVKLPDARPEVSRTAQDKSSLTSMVILTWPSALKGKAWVWLVAGVGLKPPPRERALDSCSLVVDWERSTCKRVDSPSSPAPDIHWVPVGKPPGSLSSAVGRPPTGRSFHRGHGWYSPLPWHSGDPP